MKHIGYIGTYDSDKKSGIYRFSFDDNAGKLTVPFSFFPVHDGKCLALAGNTIVISKKGSEKGGIVLIDNKGNFLSEVLTEKAAPCFITFHNDIIYTANYHDGIIMLYKIADKKLQMAKRIEIGNEAGCHQVIFYKDTFLVPCLKLDCINIYSQQDCSLIDKIEFAKGTGPRHGIFTSDEKRFYLVSELSNELFYFTRENDSWSLQKQLPIIEDKNKNAATAAIRLSADEHFIYISTRGSDLLTAFSIEGGKPVLLQQISCAGSHPRDFVLSPNSSYLLVVNRSSNEVISMHLDKNTGLIGKIAARAHVCEGVGIALH